MFCPSFWTHSALVLGSSSVCGVRPCLSQLCFGANSWGKRILRMGIALALLHTLRLPPQCSRASGCHTRKSHLQHSVRQHQGRSPACPWLWEAQGFTPTWHAGTPSCMSSVGCSQPTTEKELHIHIEIYVYIYKNVCMFKRSSYKMDFRVFISI